MPSVNLQISVHISTTDWKSVRLADSSLLNSIPNQPGVYIIHRAALHDAWPTESTFYVGATYKEGLLLRVRKHRSVLLAEKSANGQKEKVLGSREMRALGERLRHNLEDISVSYFECQDGVKSYVPFALEAELIEEFRRSNEGRMPIVNRGNR